mgnify:CR=1 FL=1
MLLFLGISITPSSAQTWLGGISSDWTDPTNWSTGSVPTAADNVTIPNRTFDPIIMNGTDALALSVGVQGGAVLTIENGGSLTINGSPGVGLINNGSVQNHGNISLGATTNIGSTAIVNGGNFRNHPDGTIQVDGTNRPSGAGHGIQINRWTTFRNEGSIILGLNKKVGRTAIYNLGNFRNDATGQVQVEACDIGIFIEAGAVNNSGAITIGSIKSPLTNGIESQATFNNNEGATLEIGKNGSWSIFSTFGSTFNNRGLLTTGIIAVGGPFQRSITTANNFNNYATGIIKCGKSKGEGIKVNSGNFRNWGSIIIGEITRPERDGIVNLGTFTNEEGATIQIEKVGDRGIYNIGPNFFNDGKITIGLNDQPNGFGYSGVKSSFTNRACGEFIIHDNIDLRINSSFTNNGLLLIDTGNGHRKDGSPFINNGIISYQGNTVVPGVVNNEIIIRPTSATGCEPISPAFLLNQVNFNILGIFSDEDATTSAGTYTQGNNTFVDDPDLADGVTHTLFVNIKDPTGDCTRSVPWKLTIDDTTPPTFTCPSDRTVDVAAGNCQGVVPDFSTIIVDAADNCGNVVIGQDVAANSTFGSADGDQVVVTITADDGNGNLNATPCQITLTVKDNEKPNISCPSNINVNNDPGQCDAVVNFTVTATDNCDGSVAVSLNQNSGTSFNVGTTTINASATDAAGNTGSCSFDVIVTDSEAPTVLCQGTLVSLGADGTYTLTDSYIFNNIVVSLNDNCGTTNQVSVSKTVLTCDDLGDVEVQFSFTDINGKTSSCFEKIGVIDPLSTCNQAPVAKCQNLTVAAELNSCEASISTSQINNGSSDPDGDDIQLTLNNEGPFSVGGPYTVELTVSDGSLSDKCTATVVVNDTQDPVIVCPTDITVDNDPGQCGAVVNYTVNFSDNCPGAALIVDPASGSFFGVGSGSVLATVSDAAGNTTQCGFNVTVNDTEDPIITCPADITVDNDPGQCGAVVNYTVNFSDNCPGATLIVDPASGSFFSVGSGSVLATVSDAAGNTAQCGFNVTVKDNEDPVIACPADITVDNDPGQCGAVVNYTVNFSDNCPGATLIVNPASGSFFSVGSGSVLATVSDAAGNTAQCSFNVTVKDNEDPVIACPADITVDNDPGQCGAVVNYTVNFNDNCPGATLIVDPASGSFFDIGTNAVVAIASDAAGNTAQCGFNVTVNDTELPSFSNCPSPINLFNDQGDCGAIASWTPPIFDDNCPDAISSATHMPGDFFPVGTTTVTYSGTDKAGNQAIECSFTVSITDSEKPKIACPGDISTGTDPGVCGTQVNFTSAIANDNCQIAEVKARYRPVDENGSSLGSWTSRVFDPSGFFPVGRYQIQWRAKDIYGNKVTCSQYLDVYDNEDPVAACKDLAIDFNGQQDISLTVSQIWDEASSSDNCGFIEFVSANLTIGCEELGNTVAIPVTIQDEAGNTDVCTSYVEVIGLPCGWVEGPNDGSLNCDGQTTSEFDADNESFTLTSEGCWQSNQNPDQAAFVYQELCGDGALTAEISSVNSGGYVGLMARESLDPLARRAGILKNNSTRRIRREWRPTYDGPVVRTSSNRSRVKWLRIVRQGDQIKSYTSTNGSSWRLLYKVNFSNLEDCIYVGMMAYSLNGSAEVEGVFENVSLSGSGTLAGGILGDPISITPEGFHAWGTVGDVGNGSIEVFPNPASDQAQLALKDFQDKPAQLILRDAFGKMVKKIKLDSAMDVTMPLEVQDLAPGVYIISLVQDQQLMVSKRLVVQP